MLGYGKILAIAFHTVFFVKYRKMNFLSTVQYKNTKKIIVRACRELLLTSRLTLFARRIKTTKQVVFLSLTLFFLIALYMFLYKVYIPRVNAFGCFDDCFNFM